MYFLCELPSAAFVPTTAQPILPMQWPFLWQSIFQCKIQCEMIGRHLPTIILIIHFANVMTISYGKAFIKAKWHPLEMDAKLLAIISNQILRMLWPHKWQDISLCKIAPWKMTPLHLLTVIFINKFCQCNDHFYGRAFFSAKFNSKWLVCTYQPSFYPRILQNAMTILMAGHL